MAGLGIEFWDAPTGASRPKVNGRFRIHPHMQEYEYRVDEGVTVCEKLFVLNRFPVGPRVDPLVAYLTIEIRNDSHETRVLDSLAGAMLRGNTARDVRVRYDRVPARVRRLERSGRPSKGARSAFRSRRTASR